MVAAIRSLEMDLRTLPSAAGAIALLASISATAGRAQADFVEDLIERQFKGLIEQCIDTDCLNNPGASVGSWRVTGLMPGQALNMFNSPNPNAATVGKIPAGTGGIRILDSLTHGRRWNGPADGPPEWCRVRYGPREGWVSFQYLVLER
jgi:hypothetical protein